MRPKAMQTAIAASAGLVALVLAGSILVPFVDSDKARSASGPTFGPGVAINVPAVAMVSRAVPGCPEPPNANCQRENGRDDVVPGSGAAGGFLVGGEGQFYAPIHLPPGARILRLELWGVDSDDQIADLSASLMESRVGRGASPVATASLFGVEPGVRVAKETTIPSAKRGVRADTAYYVTLDVPRPSANGILAGQMIRVIYRPRIS